MGRHNFPGFAVPLKSTDGSVPTQNGRGTYTLAANTTYYFPIGGLDCTVVSAHLSWTTQPIIITSATVEDSNLPKPTTGALETGGVTDEATDFDTRVGKWIDEDPSTAFVGVVGTGVSQTNGVVAATGDAAGGGCLFHVADTGARRTRIKVVVGATGGDVCCAIFGKE